MKRDHWDMDAPQLTRAPDVEQVAGQRARALPAGRLDNPDDAIAVARREAWQLPVLRQGRPAGRLPETWEGVALRLQAALWEVAARADIPVRPGASIHAVARLLVGYGAIIPPAGDAVRALAAVAEAGCAGRVGATTGIEETARLAERLAGYLALRARFG